MHSLFRASNAGPAANAVVRVTRSRLKSSRVVDGCLFLELDRSVAAIEFGQRALQGFLEDRDVSEAALYRTALAFEELVVNVVRHGLADRDEGEYRIEVSVCVPGDEIVLTMEDDGPPFDPLQVPEPPSPSSIQDAKIGGLGLWLVRTGAKRMEYERIADRNRVTLTILRQ